MNFLNTITLETDLHYQNTINEKITFSGVGIHEGKAVDITLIPADPDTGIIFKRVDLTRNNLINVNYKNIVKSRFCSKIQNDFGVSVFTVEHLMSALGSLSIDNLTIEINAPELPAMDGSALEYTLKILETGKKIQNKKRKYIRIKKRLSTNIGKRWIEVAPSNQLKLDIEIDYPNTIIGKDNYCYFHDEINFVKNICLARTFALANDVNKLRASGFAIGGNLNNAILVDKKNIINESGLRCEKEFIKHKVLDCLGDFYLSGYQIIGSFKSFAPGHELNSEIIEEIFKSESNYEIVQLNDSETPNVTPEINSPNYGVA